MSRTRTTRPARVVGAVAYIPLTRGYEAVVDAGDAEALSAFKWRAVVRKHTVYASRSAPGPDGRWVDIFMHRQITNAAPDRMVDHADGDGLNNRRANLRECGRADNARNMRRRNRRPLPKGVEAQGDGFAARIYIDQREVRLGTFNTAAEAAAAYLGAAKIAYGDFAKSGS